MLGQAVHNHPQVQTLAPHDSLLSHAQDRNHHEVVDGPTSREGVHQVPDVVNVTSPALVIHCSPGGIHNEAGTVTRLASQVRTQRVSQMPNSALVSLHGHKAADENTTASTKCAHQVSALSSNHNSGDVHQVAVSNVVVNQPETVPSHVPENNGNGNDKTCYNSNELPTDVSSLDPEAASFILRDKNLVQHGRLYPDLAEDWDHVQQVQAGGVGNIVAGNVHLWENGAINSRAGHVGGKLESLLPFKLVDDIPAVLGLAPKQIQKVRSLLDKPVRMPNGTFTDKALPAPSLSLKINEIFTADYYIALHNITAAPGFREDGSSYPAYTPNHLGARVSIPHCGLRRDRWRYHLIGYQDVEIVQFMEFGFPLGLSSLPDLECVERNHGSAYMWFNHVDKFVCTEVSEGGLTGPFEQAPWWNTIISPLMTAHKKELSRRTVFDATFGVKSLNNSTPSDYYMGLPCKYTFPKIQDYKDMVLTSGPGAFMWKRDLSRFFLQLPLDPTEYHRVGIIWRGLFFFFLGLAFGLRHSGLQGQKVTDAVSWIHRRLGMETSEGKPYQVTNYVDDLGGVESTKEKATESFEKMNWLLSDLGLNESLKKAEPPNTKITYLGVQFDSLKMTMSVPPEKITEIKSEIGLWVKKTTISKKDLQSLLGKLFWVAKVVRNARPFMGRLLAQLRTMTNLKDGKKVKLLEETRKDILWWNTYLDRFNGISMIVNEDPIPLSYEQLLDDPHGLCAGDATPTGGGAWHGREYWCGSLPIHLQDPQIPIHVKEFWVLIVSVKQWGDTWTGRCVVLYCDNDSVCDTVVYKKPRDPTLLSLLREFLFVVVTKKFFPVVRKIGTKENEMADHISRRFDPQAAAQTFAKFGLHNMSLVKPRAEFFNLTATW